MQQAPPRSGMLESGIKYMLAGGTIVAALGLLVEPQTLLAQLFPPKTDPCQTVIDGKAVLSRDRLSQLLTLPERSQRNQVRQVLQSPYCRLSDVSIRAGSTANREAYPLAFDPQTWLIVLYEGDEYAGYAFSFRR